jgi:hypothetical protein
MAICRDWVFDKPERPDPDPRRLVVCRTRQGAVEILTQQTPGSGREALTRIADELRYPSPDQVIAEGAELLVDVRRRHILVGTRRSLSQGFPSPV